MNPFDAPTFMGKMKLPFVSEKTEETALLMTSNSVGVNKNPAVPKLASGIPAEVNLAIA